MAAPHFSVLLPTHNRPDVLPFAIESVLAQTIGDFELLIAGDGCTDHTAGVVRQYTDPRIRWFDLPKAPYFGAANRNIVLKEARADLIAYISHDDLWLRDHLAMLAPAFEDSSSEFAYSLPLYVSPDGIIHPRSTNLNDERTLERLKRLQTGIGISPVIHRRSCFEEYGYWNENLSSGADSELFHRIIVGGGRGNVAYFPIPTTLHFVANWRKWPLRSKLRAKMYELDGSLPPDLVMPLPAGMSEQQALSEHLSKDPSARLRDLRRAVQLDLDRRASAAYPSVLLTFLYEQYKRVIG